MIATSAAQKGDIGIYVNALGVVTPINTVMVKSRVDGQLMSVNYVEGQMLHAGDSLVEIDPRPYQAQLTQVEGQLARDQALLENARVDLERYQIANSKNAIPKQQLDTQVATVHQYEGTVKLDQGQVDTAKLQITYSHITAPFSGRVGLRLVDPGNIVHATDLDNQIDTTTGTLKLKAIFTNEDESLFPNQFVNARLLVDTLHDATLVPNTVVQRNAESAFVYVLKPGQTVAMQTITVGTTDGNASAVEGIAPGAVVAADNFNRLTDGAKVTVRKPSNEGSVERRNVERTGQSPTERSDASTLPRSHASTPTR